MRWLYATIGLLAASACLVGWIYLRDRDTTPWHPSEFQTVQFEARTVLALAAGHCLPDCKAHVLGPTGPHRWLAKLTIRGRSRCWRINTYAFSVSAQHGITGIKSSGCALHP